VRRIATLSIVAFVAALSLAGAAGAITEAPTGFKDCGDVAKVGAGAYNVQAKHVGCFKARKVADRYFHEPTTRIGNFTCGETEIGNELFRGRCVRTEPRGVIKFLFGA
jgi:hypothetical protein